MSTISDIAIKHNSPLKIQFELEQFYLIGEKVIKDYSNEFEFLEKNPESRTFVIHQEQNTSWTQIGYSLENLYELDEILRRLTYKFETIAFIGYNQTTSGDFRFALFKNGNLVRSLFLKYIEHQNQIRVVDNFGNKLDFEKIEFGTPITRPINDNQKLDYFIFNDWYKELGFEPEERCNIEYVHLEVLNFRN